MHVISRKKLLDFGRKHPNAKTSLDHRYRIIKKTDFASFAELRKTFPATDQVGDFVVFNVGGNKIRLISLIFYKGKKVYVRHVLTHAEYGEGNWKE